MPASEVDFQPGDIAACWGGDLAGRGISLATASLLAPRGLRWGPSHVAIIARRADRSFWIESTTLSRRACSIRGRIVPGVQAHAPADRLSDYRAAGGHVAIYRLIPIESLSTAETRLLERLLLDHILPSGAAYDLGGALLSGTRVFQFSRLFPGADLTRLFCSELIAAVLMRLGRLPRGNPTRYSPAWLLRTLVRNGTYQRVDLQEARA
jgi:hypothetical protein